MKFKYSQLRDPNFGRAWSKVAAYNGYKSPCFAINIAKMNKAFLEESKVSDEAYHKLALQFAVVNAAGDEFTTPEGGQKGSFEIREDAQKEWRAALKEFNEVEFEVAQKPLPVAEILPAGLSPLDLTFLDSLLAPVLETV